MIGCSFFKMKPAKREIASIFRSDLSLIISKFEYTLLTEQFNIDAALLFYVPFLIDVPKEKDISQLPEFDQRQDFMTIGNFRHQPNLDAVKYLHAHIWPLIRKELPEVKLEIYGPYAPEVINHLHNPQSGFLIKGWIPDKKEAVCQFQNMPGPFAIWSGSKR